MKASAEILAAPVFLDKSKFAVWSELFKARLTALVVVTTAAGFFLGATGPVDGWLMVHALLGTALVAAGAAALNQWWERDYDRLMPRTQHRPLPAGALAPEMAVRVGGATAVAGLVHLAVAVNGLTALLAGLTLGLYLLVYTPLKRITPLNTIVGAVPGALPPLIGWTAARGEITREGLALFALQFFWQVPHFLAIAWLYRDQYAQGGFAMLPVVDETGERTGSQTVSHALGLWVASLCPVLLGMAGWVYLAAALPLGGAFAWLAVQFARDLRSGPARRLFLASLLYLPLVLGALVLDKALS